MAKRDFEKDKRKRKPRDICPDAPWRPDFVGFIDAERFGPSRFGHSPNVPGTPSKQLAPSGVANRLRGITMDLAGPKFAIVSPQAKMEHLAKIQSRLTRIAELHGPAIKETTEFREAQAACTHEGRPFRSRLQK